MSAQRRCYVLTFSCGIFVLMLAVLASRNWTKRQLGTSLSLCLLIFKSLADYVHVIFFWNRRASVWCFIYCLPILIFIIILGFVFSIIYHENIPSRYPSYWNNKKARPKCISHEFHTSTRFTNVWLLLFKKSCLSFRQSYGTKTLCPCDSNERLTSVVVELVAVSTIFFCASHNTLHRITPTSRSVFAITTT